MINSKQNIVTDDVETRPPEIVKDSLGKLITRKGNPHWQLWQGYLNKTISIDELYKTLRGKLLKSTYKMTKQKYPPEPVVMGKKISRSETKNIMKGWGRACEHIDCVNAGNKHWLGVLLNDLVNGKLTAEQGKEEEIEELLSEYY